MDAGSGRRADLHRPVLLLCRASGHDALTLGGMDEAITNFTSRNWLGVSVAGPDAVQLPAAGAEWQDRCSRGSQDWLSRRSSAFIHQAHDLFRRTRRLVA